MKLCQNRFVRFRNIDILVYTGSRFLNREWTLKHTNIIMVSSVSCDVIFCDKTFEYVLLTLNVKFHRNRFIKSEILTFQFLPEVYFLTEMDNYSHKNDIRLESDGHDYLKMKKKNILQIGANQRHFAKICKFDSQFQIFIRCVYLYKLYSNDPYQNKDILEF